MNHLAHFTLAHPEPGLIVGAFLGDFVKGRLTGDRPAAVERGIRLHRAIDAFTDGHEIVRHSARRFDPAFRRYAPILIDLVFDHFLARSWHEHSERGLGEFSDDVFETVLAARSMLPEDAAITADRMSEARSLERYANTAFLQRSFVHVGERLQRDNPMKDAYTEFERLEAELSDDFELFFPALIAFSQHWQQTHQKSNA